MQPPGIHKPVTLYNKLSFVNICYRVSSPKNTTHVALTPQGFCLSSEQKLRYFWWNRRAGSILHRLQGYFISRPRNVSQDIVKI